ncbi:MAG: MBL fold metallo-hydrolase [Gammaproteobacteria bacterium]|nr:MBL fold metallo-hydrolase [Gammaproteobacteria bacterium]
MRVTTLGHASVLIEMGQDKILIDPIFDDVFASGTLCLHPPRNIEADALIAATTVLVITHIHLDHFHPPTLTRFPRNVQMIIPMHDALQAAVSALGFTAVTVLAPWSRYVLDAGSLVATPSDFELEEFGLLAIAGEERYWHMSDAIVTPEIGQRVRAEYGAMSLAAVKFQPLRTLIAYQRGLASTMLDRDDLTSTFEAACAAEPACLFPYYSGFAFHGEHAWANRHIAPYQAEEIAALLRQRLGDASRVETVAPGDVFEIAARAIDKHPGSSPYVRVREAPPVQPWEPIDPTTLAGVAGPSELVWLTLEVRRLLTNEIHPWVQAHLDAATGLFDSYRALQAVWQCVIHLGDDRRLHHGIDFRSAPPRLYLDQVLPTANVFSHLGGRSLLQVLRRHSGPEVFWMAGGYRIYEKLLYLDNGKIRAPAMPEWELYERLPDPLTHYLRKVPRPAISG